MANHEKTAIEKSHSKSSNAKLTLLCIVTILAFSALWVGLAFLQHPTFPLPIAWIITIAGGVVTVLGLLGFNVFKR